MKSFRAVGVTHHERYAPTRHAFQYPVTMFALDLDELPQLNGKIRGLSIDRWNLQSLWQEEYGGWEAGSIKEKIIARCTDMSPNCRIDAVTLLTMPRTFGFVFNPVSFYLCKDAGASLQFLVLEINNTFYERCQYVLPVAQAKRIGAAFQWRLNKEFHVSPFFEMDYEYVVTLVENETEIRVDILLFRDSTAVFSSDVELRRVPLTSGRSIPEFFSDAYRMLVPMPLIMYQAIQLSLRRRLPVLTKPDPVVPPVIRATPVSLVDQLCLKLGRRHAAKLRHGRLALTLPDGRAEYFGDESAPATVLQVKNFAFFRKVLLAGGVGFGESYCDGDWDAPDIPAVLKLFLNNYEFLQGENIPLLPAVQFLNTVRHWLRRNTLRGSKRNIQEHYDLSNDFFRLFLDSSMVYSAGIYSHASATLEDAQRLKLDTIARKARLSEGMSVLEIGSGWGALAEHCAREAGCSVVSLTLSEEQKAYAEQHAKTRGLKDRISYQLKDYRAMTGSFDRIVSVEMLEAVGREHLQEFFASANRLLRSDGVLVVQVISYPDTHYAEYCKRSDWIQKHIFPGSHLPSLSALLAAAARESFIADDVQNIAPDYARTLRDWRARFELHREDVLRLGFDENFMRKWRFYLASCEAEFDTRWLSVYQIVFTRPNNIAGFQSERTVCAAEEVA